MMCVVQKDFVGAGEQYVRNQLIDASIFRNVNVLVSQRFLRPATEDEIASAQPIDEEPEPPKKKPVLKAKMAKRKG